jgi:membrane-associated protein
MLLKIYVWTNEQIAYDSHMMAFDMMTLPEMIASVGYLGIFIIVFIESGIPIGVILPLPGDTLLFSAGLLAATSVFDLTPLIATIVVAAILGDSAGYWFGSHYGPKLFTKEKALLFSQKNVVRTETFYAKYGWGAIIIARFLPFFRTVVPIFAGVGRMHYPSFVFFNILGACIWGVSITLLGFYLGTMIPNIDHYILPVLAVVVLITSTGMWLEYRKSKKEAL